MGSVARTASLTYDLNGTLKTLSYLAGFTVTYERNADGQVTAIKKGGSSGKYCASWYFFRGAGGTEEEQGPHCRPL